MNALQLDLSPRNRDLIFPLLYPIFSSPASRLTKERWSLQWAHPINLAHQTCRRRSLPPRADSSAADTSASASASSSFSGLGGGFGLRGCGIGGSEAPKALAEFIKGMKGGGGRGVEPDPPGRLCHRAGGRLRPFVISSVHQQAPPPTLRAVLQRGRRGRQSGRRRGPSILSKGSRQQRAKRRGRKQ